MAEIDPPTAARALALGVRALVAAASLRRGRGRRRAVADESPRSTCAPTSIVLALADPEQILTVSWLAADPEESLLANEAQRHTLNYGTAEELLKFAPDVVLAGTYTSPFTRTMLRRFGYRVVELEPEELRRRHRAQRAARRSKPSAKSSAASSSIAQLRADVHAIEANRPAQPLAAVIVRPGGFTVGAGLARHELLDARGAFATSPPSAGSTAGAACRWRRCCAARPSVIVLTGYRSTQPSLANAVLEHPALAALGAAQRTVTVPSALWACGLPGSIEAAALLQRATER